jgi:PAS domain S-box-containing protein
MVADVYKPKSQLLEELNDLRELIEILRAYNGYYQHVESELQTSLRNLELYQEELQTANEDLSESYAELQKAQQRADEMRRKYEQLFDFAPIGYFTINLLMIIQEVNLTGANMLGHHRRHLLGKPLLLFVEPEARELLATHFRRVFNGLPASLELTFVNKGGQRIPIILQSTPYQHEVERPPVCLSTIIDITARKQAEQALQESNDRLADALVQLHQTQKQLIQQERLAAIGQLSAGIAHDFNNILTSVIGFADLLRLNPNAPPEKRQHDLSYIVEQGQRAARLVRQILDFSRQSYHHPREIDLGLFLKEEVRLLRRTIPETIKINLEIRADGFFINADTAQMQQILTNLALNARDAMPSGGNLEIALSYLSLAVNQPVPVSELTPGQWVVMTITDTGMGIEPLVLPRIFEPFFTTKEVGQGSGLGLAQVYGIVKQHNGVIGVDSRPGHGTTFRFYFPNITTFSPTLPADSSDLLPMGNQETILLVEDDVAVLAVNEEMLTELNYRVLIASNGVEALAVYADCEGKVDLVLSDIVMAEMDGLVLLDQLHHRNPDLIVILMTGYALDEEAQSLMTEQQIRILEKPITLHRLAQLLNQVLLA